MQTLVLGNGFDIDHELPTKYKNFLCFVEAVRGSQRLRGKVDALPSTVDTELKKYIYNLFLYLCSLLYLNLMVQVHQYYSCKEPKHLYSLFY